MKIKLLISETTYSSGTGTINESDTEVYVIKITGSGTFTRTYWTNTTFGSGDWIGINGENGKSFSFSGSCVIYKFKKFQNIYGVSTINANSNITVGALEADLMHRTIFICPRAGQSYDNNSIAIQYDTNNSSQLKFFNLGKSHVIMTAPQKFTLYNNSSGMVNILFVNMPYFTQEKLLINYNVYIPKVIELVIE